MGPGPSVEWLCSHCVWAPPTGPLPPHTTLRRCRQRWGGGVLPTRRPLAAQLLLQLRKERGTGHRLKEGNRNLVRRVNSGSDSFDSILKRG